MLYESILTLRGSVRLSKTSSLNLAGEPQKWWKSWLLGFCPKSVPIWWPCLIKNSSYREATDLRLLPSDASYIIVPRKIRGNQIEIGDVEKFSINHLKRTHMSVSLKSPTSSPCTWITLYSTAKAYMLYESILTLRGSVGLSIKSSLNPAREPLKS